jgi:hypothetical protein
LGREKGEEMKVVIEPDYLRKMLSSLLIVKNGQVFDAVTAVFKKEGMMVKDVAKGVLIVIGAYSKSYFTSYEVEKDETVVLTSSLLTALGWRFTDKEVTLETVGNELILKGSKERYAEKLQNSTQSEATTKLEVNPDRGIVPTKFWSGKTYTNDCAVSIELPKTELDLPKSEDYEFTCDEKDLIAQVRQTQGNYVWSTKLKSQRSDKLQKMSIVLDGEYLGKIAANLSENFWLMLTGTGAAFVCKTKDYSLTYLMTAVETEAQE